jgi:hypothetical protein
MAEPEGTLVVRRKQELVDGTFREDRVQFRDLQGLLDLCAVQEKGAAFVQVQVVGTSGGKRQRLVLDFGHFGLDSEP